MSTKLPPLCTCCGKPIGKRMRTVWITAKKDREKYHQDFGSTFGRVYVDDPTTITTKEQCQALTNFTVISVSYNRTKKDHRELASDYGSVRARHISTFRDWDGASYVDDFFCTDRCAVKFGYVMARAGYQTKAHEEAKQRQQGAES